MIVSGMILASPVFVRGAHHTFECVFFTSDGGHTQVCPGAVKALKTTFSDQRIEHGWSMAGLPVVRLIYGPLYDPEALIYIGGKFAGAVSVCFGGMSIDVNTFVAIGNERDRHFVVRQNWHSRLPARMAA